MPRYLFQELFNTGNPIGTQYLLELVVSTRFDISKYLKKKYVFFRPMFELRLYADFGVYVAAMYYFSENTRIQFSITSGPTYILPQINRNVHICL